MKIFEEIESEVQCYARAFPRLFNKAQGEYLYDTEGNQYLDFLAGAGTLNFGHNNPIFKKKLLEYIEADGITHGLDLHTKAKGEFLNTFNEKILKPRNMEYMVQFTGPTGANAVETAMKLARKLSNEKQSLASLMAIMGSHLAHYLQQETSTTVAALACYSRVSIPYPTTAIWVTTLIQPHT